MFTEDLTVFFNADEHATAATLNGVAVSGIFDNGTGVSDGGVGMITTVPSFTLATSVVPASPVGKAMVINGVTYSVAEHHPDGTGVSVLELERAT